MKTKRRYKKWLWLGGTIVLVGVVALMSLSKPEVVVDVISVQKGRVEQFVEDEGVVKATNAQKVFALDSGQIENLLWEAGDLIKSGETMCVISDADFVYRISAMTSQRQSLEKNLEALKQPADKERLRIARGDVDIAKTQLEDAKQQYLDGKALYASGALSLNAVNQLKMAYDLAVILHNQATEALSLMEKGASKPALEEMEAQIQALNYEIESLEANRERLEIGSPLTGTVVDRFVELGAYVTTGTPIYEVADLDTLYIETALLVSDTLGVIKGSAVEIRVEDTDLVSEGEVLRVYPKAFSAMSELGVEQKRIKLDIGMLKPFPLLYGSEVDLKVYQGVKDQVLRIPEGARFTYDEKPHVFVVEGDLLRLRAIEVGLEGNEWIEVVSGLEEGEQVVDTPDSGLEPNMTVRVMVE